MNSIILRCVTLVQCDHDYEIVGSAEDGGDIFIKLQVYLQKNKIKYVDEIPQEEGLFCEKKDDTFIVSSNQYVTDWQIKDEKPPLYCLYVCTLRLLYYDNDSKTKHPDKNIL